MPALTKVWEGIDIKTIPPQQGTTVDEWELVRLLLDVSAKIGPTAKPLFGQAERVFRAERFDRYLRSMAAYAMIRINGIEETWERFKELDPIGESATLWTLGTYAVEENAAGRLDEPTAKRIQERLVAGLKHSNAEVRQMALRNLDPGFAGKFLIIRSSTDFEVNPLVKSIVEEMSVQDPDPKVREAAAQLLSRP